MESLMVILGLAILSAALIWAYSRAAKRRKPPARPPVERDDVPKDYDGSGGWFGRKDRP